MMYPAERQAAILDAARAQGGEVAVQQLSDSLGVTAETVRRDLASLERRGLVRRRHGGATLVSRLPFELSMLERGLVEALERRAVAEAVVTDLPEHGVILLDSGSMTLEVAAALARRAAAARAEPGSPTRNTGAGPLTVVTTSLPVAELLRGHPALSALVLPGTVRPVTQAVVGPWAEERLAELRVDVAVLGANGVTAGVGAFTTLPEEAAIKQRMLAAARRRVLAVTATKFGTDSLCRFAGLDRFDVVMTDSRLDAATADLVTTDGPELVLAHPAATAPAPTVTDLVSPTPRGTP
ncbi:DeoR/GlpR family DNA-binding transcription regulator [Herbiconiux sp. P18]|uniref:DeoR/GlpR family DNA-binding transcription regulator n=1 Tax=Herbiconiux liangxiaofengii TaxID=3342795 RepID=UPI0035B857ED